MLPTDSPPEFGILRFDVPVAPVSFQAPSWRKEAIVAVVRGMVAPCRYLLSGDVKIVIEWGISERARYEADSAADVDNIVKPILDALSGPDGIMIDDCQVQELTCFWTGGYFHPTDERIVIELKFDPDGFLPKEGLIFLHIERGLYFPIHDDLPGPMPLRLAEHIAARFRSARQWASESLGAESARLTLPIQRVFHKSKIGAFRTTTLEELRRRFS